MSVRRLETKTSAALKNLVQRRAPELQAVYLGLVIPPPYARELTLKMELILMSAPQVAGAVFLISLPPPHFQQEAAVPLHVLTTLHEVNAAPLFPAPADLLIAARAKPVIRLQTGPVFVSLIQSQPLLEALAPAPILVKPETS